MRKTSPIQDLRILLAASALALAGCAVRVEMPELPPHHPANPQAEAAPLPPPSPLLDSYRTPAPPVPAPEGAHEMDHAHTGGGEGLPAEHDHSGHPMESMDKAGAEQQVVYACPMHPEVRSKEPGRCPKCGMELVPEKEEP